MTETTVIPHSDWAEIQPKLPRIQINDETESRRPPFFGGIGIGFDPETNKWLVLQQTLTRNEVETKLELDDLRKQLTSHLVGYYQGMLEAAVQASVYDILFTVAKQIPYPQDCQCQHYPAGQALDCHVHMENPRHFIEDFDFPCSCD